MGGGAAVGRGPLNGFVVLLLAGMRVFASPSGGVSTSAEASLIAIDHVLSCAGNNLR